VRLWVGSNGRVPGWIEGSSTKPEEADADSVQFCHSQLARQTTKRHKKTKNKNKKGQLLFKASVSVNGEKKERSCLVFCLVLSCLLSCLVFCLVLSFVLSCFLLSFVLFCLVLSCLLSCLLLSCRLLSCLLSCLCLVFCLVLSCHATPFGSKPGT
jgi:hypothetical protein